MVKLDCGVVGCAYNEDRCCKRENIQVGGSSAMKASETNCASFLPKGTNAATNACGCAKKETKVSCDAVNCCHNENRTCHAKKVDIAGRHAVTCGETECGSFCPR